MQHRIKIADRGQLHLGSKNVCVFLFVDIDYYTLLHDQKTRGRKLSLDYKFCMFAGHNVMATESDGAVALLVDKIVPQLHLVLCLIAYSPNVHNIYLEIYQHPKDHNYNISQTWNVICLACYM